MPLKIAVCCAALLMGAAAARAETVPAAPPPAGGTAATPGPVTVRAFRPMSIRLIRLREVHTPVYFRSPLAEPSSSDAPVDRCPPALAGVAVADWFLFTGRVLAFPVETALRPVWQTRPLGQ